MFESDEQSYELILCASFAREEEVWKETMSQHIADEKRDELGESSMTTVLNLEISVLSPDVKSHGPIFSLPGALTGSQSIERAATLNRKSDRQVVIKNTHLPNDGNDLHITVSESLNRSKSSPSANSITILAPKRIERHKIEQGMANVWTRDRLPYSSIASHRGGYLKHSASTVMRKLSKASTATTSTANSVKRSVSYTSISEASPYSVDVGASRMAHFDRSSSPTHGPIPGPRNCATLTPQSRKSISFGTMAVCRSIGESGLIEPEVDSMIYVTKIRSSSEGSGQIASREVSGASTVVASASRDSLELGRTKGKIRKTKTLLKAFSTEGIRSWFH